MRRTIIVAALAVACSGCARMFQADIEKAVSKTTVAAADCKPRKPKGAAESLLDTRIQNALTAQILSAEPYLRDLNSKLGDGSGFSATSDLRTGQNVIALAVSDRRLFGVDLSQFSADVMLVDDEGIKAAQASLQELSRTRLLAPNSSEGIRVDREQWRGFTKNLANATATSGWTADMVQSLGKLSRAYRVALQKRRGDVASIEMDASLREAAQEFKRKALLALYFRAYFRNGRIFEVQFDGQSLEKDLLAKIDKVVTGPIRDQLKSDIEKVNANFQKKLCGGEAPSNGACTILGSLGEQTFVTRAGKSYGFPGVTATLDPTAAKKVATNKFNSDDIVEDLVRVFVEAAGDASSTVPGVANSTLCAAEKSRCATAAESSVVQQVNDVGDATEASANSITSELVRGGWLFALNNEALAKSITTFVSVGARKVAEAAVWNRRMHACEATNVHREISVTISP